MIKSKLRRTKWRFIVVILCGSLIPLISTSSWALPIIKTKVPSLEQPTSWSCATTVALMMLEYYDETWSDSVINDADDSWYTKWDLDNWWKNSGGSITDQPFKGVLDKVDPEHDGATASEFAVGVDKYLEAAGWDSWYKVETDSTKLTWNQYKGEIGSCWPVQSGIPGHSILLVGYDEAVGKKYMYVEDPNDGVSGRRKWEIEEVTGGGLKFKDGDYAGQQLTDFVKIHPTPEPTTMALFAVGLAGLSATHIRSKRKRGVN